jgi:hypothetical protein
MRGDDARKVCPEINLVQVPTHFGKADLSDYRDAGSEVRSVLTSRMPVPFRAHNSEKNGLFYVLA